MWRRRPGADEELLVRVLDGETLVFDDLTGDTHLLTPLAGRLLALLDDRPRGVDELALADDAPQAIEATLRGMTALGLVVGRPPCASRS